MESTNALTTSSSEVPSGTSTNILPWVVYSTLTVTSSSVLLKASRIVFSISSSSSVLKDSVTGLLISILAMLPVIDGVAVGILEVGASTGDCVGNGITRAISSFSIFNPSYLFSIKELSTSSKIRSLSLPSMETSISIIISSSTWISSTLIPEIFSRSGLVSNSSLIAVVISSLFVSSNDWICSASLTSSVLMA